MLSWGQDGLRGFRLKGGSVVGNSTGGGVRYSNLGYLITDLSAGRGLLAVVKSHGNAFIIRTNEGKDGRRVRGKQKFVKYKGKIRAVSCGDETVTLLSETGRVLCVDPGHTPLVPRPLEALSNIPVVQVACGSQHSVVLTREGQVYTWGQDSRGQLGQGTWKLGTRSPQHLRSLSAVPLVQVAAGGEQSFALSVSGGVFGWGANSCGQLGLGDTTGRHSPTPVHCLNMKKTVHISCGKDHTAVLTKDGAVFTFGSGQYGQLGHNSFSDELRPRLVAELWGAKVTKIACGRHHTLVLTDSERVHSFGCGEQGQLGHGEESHPSVPLPVQVPLDTADDPKIRNIFAGENCSFATCTTNEDVNEESNSNVTHHCLDDVIDKWTSECDGKSWKKIKLEIHWMFSSASCVNKSFLDQSNDKHFRTSPKYCGLNLSLAEVAFEKLVKEDNVLAEMLPSLDKKPVGVEGLRIFLLLNELLHVMQSTDLAKAAAAAIVSLSADSLQVIGDWWSSLSPSTMVKHVGVWKQALSVILSSDPAPRNRGVKNVLLVLQFMYNANSRIAEPLRMPESDFCLVANQHFFRFLLGDLWLWLLRSQHKNGHAEPLILCSFPIVMDLKSKKLIFDANAEYTKCVSLEGDRMHSPCSPCEKHTDVSFQLHNAKMECGNLLFPNHVFKLNLRRSLVLEDTFDQLADAHHSDYKMRLVVYFDENYTFDHVHVKDFFYEVFHEMVSAESGMFMFNDSTIGNKTLAWFPSNAAQEDRRYFHFGVLCGLALYNQCIIHLPFPLALFKKLLGVEPSLGDIMEFSPGVGKSLQCILEECKDDDIENLGIDFIIDWDGTEVDLDPQNPGKPVTSQNKKEFVDAYVNHAFNTSVEGVFQEFERGFFQLCDRDLVKLFRPEELQEVLVGKEVRDWAKLKQNTCYEGEYHVDHPTIQMFWEVFGELTEDQKKAFLWFVTGFEKVPIIGMEEMKMKVRVGHVKDLSHDEHYPETQTCFSILELPLYSTKEIMQTKLTEALRKNRRILK